MRRLARRIQRLGLALLVLGGLGFGASQAVAGIRAPDDCQPCSSTPECNTCCIDVLHFSGGECWAENCICF